MAKLLLLKGASVTIAARRLPQLKEVRLELELFIQKGQKLAIAQVDVTDGDSAKNLIVEAEKVQGRSIDDVICCAGAAVPGFFVDQSPKVFAQQMNLNYQGTVNIVHVSIPYDCHSDRRLICVACREAND